MSTTSPDVEPAGLPAGRMTEQEIERRDGDELLAAAAAGKQLRDDEQADLLDYFLTNKGLPGDSKPRRVEVTIEDDETGSSVTDVWQVKRIAWDEWRDATENATVTDQDGEQMTDRYVAASWAVARALVRPKLGPAVLRLQEEAKVAADKKIDSPDGRVDPPADAADLLRRMFAKQSDVLIELGGYVLRISKLSGQGGAIKALDEEVAAGKR